MFVQWVAMVLCRQRCRATRIRLISTSNLSQLVITWHLFSWRGRTELFRDFSHFTSGGAYRSHEGRRWPPIPSAAVRPVQTFSRTDPSRPDALKEGPVPSGPADRRDAAVPSRPSQRRTDRTIRGTGTDSFSRPGDCQLVVYWRYCPVRQWPVFRW